MTALFPLAGGLAGIGGSAEGRCRRGGFDLAFVGFGLFLFAISLGYRTLL